MNLTSQVNLYAKTEHGDKIGNLRMSDKTFFLTEHEKLLIPFQTERCTIKVKITGIVFFKKKRNIAINSDALIFKNKATENYKYKLDIV